MEKVGYKAYVAEFYKDKEKPKETKKAIAKKVKKSK